MSYTVLARKWRPRCFEEVVGQEHVVKALMNSLAAERLHQAYLFEGTRGVGKTTIARILAKALNCADGVVAEPCGLCDACTAIDEGRFVDLIELDSASHTGVENMREMLENVQYTPALGRYKVYLIDEVHMLSKHSFNALLKTLEEPPPHMKFFLATTEPRTLPATVLSRCLQFSLKRISSSGIQDHLTKICEAEEGISAEPQGLSELSKAAEGSVRDALSLLDQAIAFNNGIVSADAVNSMLGSIDSSRVQGLVNAIADGDGSRLLDEVSALDEHAPDYEKCLDEIMATFQRIAVIQLVGPGISEDEADFLEKISKSLSPEDVQLYYQIALHGCRDLAICRDHRVAFEMTLLRMLAFRPAVVDNESPPDRSARKAELKQRPAEPEEGKMDQSAHTKIQDWGLLLKALKVTGPARQLAENCVLRTIGDRRLELVMADEHMHLNTQKICERLEIALTEHLGQDIFVSITMGETGDITPAQAREASESERMRIARDTIQGDSNVEAIKVAFDAVLEMDSIQSTKT